MLTGIGIRLHSNPFETVIFARVVHGLVDSNHSFMAYSINLHDPHLQRNSKCFLLNSNSIYFIPLKCLFCDSLFCKHCNKKHCFISMTDSVSACMCVLSQPLSL